MARKIICSVALDLDQLERIDTISRKTRISRSELIREGLATVLRRHEEQLRLFEDGYQSVTRRHGQPATRARRR